MECNSLSTYLVEMATASDLEGVLDFCQKQGNLIEIVAEDEQRAIDYIRFSTKKEPLAVYQVFESNNMVYGNV